jgi:DNA-binding response OmpR family regulator
MSTALILAEPKADERGYLERHLIDDGFEVLAADDPLTLPAADADLALLGDAAALERWRAACPVIVLGAETDAPVDRVHAFARGCDDYLARPFLYEELVARIHAVLRRGAARAHRHLEAAGIVVDATTRRASVDGRRVALAGKEFELLVKLASDPTRVFTKEQLLRDVWGYVALGRTRTLESHASRLRRKLAEAAGGKPRYVVNVWGVGYRLLDLDD